MRPDERKSIARCFVWGVESRVNVKACNPPSYGAEWYEGFPVAKSYDVPRVQLCHRRGRRESYNGREQASFPTVEGNEVLPRVRHATVAGYGSTSSITSVLCRAVN
jgi:hypothetical protein